MEPQGVSNQPALHSRAPGGNYGEGRYVLLRGYQETVSLDARGRFRIPDELAGLLQRESGRLARAGASLAPAGYQRLGLYFVPGPQRLVLLYPAPNIELALQPFDNPPDGVDPKSLRRARNYLYMVMRYVEADTQNRFVIPPALRRHAGLEEGVDQIALVADGYRLTLMRAERLAPSIEQAFEDFDRLSLDLLDPLRRTPPGTVAGD